MSAPGKGPPAKSGWGTFISSAFEGVESKLDNMLNEPELQQQAQQSKPAGIAPQSKDSLKPGTSHSRSSSSTRANDRLQARLAKAMAGKGGSPRESPRASIDVPARTSTDGRSMDCQAEGKNRETGIDTEKETDKQPKKQEENGDSNAIVTPPATETAPPNLTAPMSAVPRNAEESENPPEPVVSPPENTTNSEKAAETREVSETPTQAVADSQSPPPVSEAEKLPPEGQPLPKDIEELRARHQEEVSEYLERIDSLQSKLQYLSKTAASDAKKTAQAAPSGSAERKLAEKDEKIALLMEEGQKLSSNEHKLRMLIKKLRSQIAEHEKWMEDLRKSKDKAVIEMEALKKRSSSGEGQQKKDDETKKAMAGLQKEIDALKKERTAKDEAVKKIEQDLKSQREKAEAAAAQAHKKELSAEREKTRALEDAIAALQSEKDASAIQWQHETTEWKEKLERATERNKNMGTELQLELQTMESKLEAMRVTAEEATSGSGGDSQANMIRQMETLQSQYATATENWRGIEASLITKVTNLEKERDEAQKRESDMRRKARDAATKSRRFEEDLEDLQPELAATRQELEASREEVAALRASYKDSVTAIEQARADLEKQQRISAREYSADNDRRQQWVDDTPGSRGQSRPDSPLLSVPRTFSSDLVGFQVPGRPRRHPTPGSIPDSAADGLGISFGRRQSSQPPGRSGLSTAGSQLPPPYLPFDPSGEASNIPPTPSVAERDEVADRVPSSPRNVAQDMISVSTVGAGPSVQLVERMSAAIRRLEAEKVAAKEEMARVCSQRDEARSDMVGLMKQVEEAKSASAKVPELEQEVESLNQRYQTTLELLGEKSELVEELKADVEDVKQMYRELVERAVK